MRRREESGCKSTEYFLPVSPIGFGWLASKNRGRINVLFIPRDVVKLIQSPILLLLSRGSDSSNVFPSNKNRHYYSGFVQTIKNFNFNIYAVTKKWLGCSPPDEKKVNSLTF